MTNQNPTHSAPGSVTEVNAHLLQEVLDTPAKDTYGIGDLLDAARAEVVKANFANWVLARFYEEAEDGFEFEVLEGRRLGTKIGVERGGGYTSWSMQTLTQGHGADALLGRGSESGVPFVRMLKYTADDRGPGSHGPVVAFPLDVLFGERKRNEAYAEFLRLKAIFEPGESDGQP